MVGTSVTRSGDATVFEYLRIVSSAARVVFYAQPNGVSPAVAFELAHSEPNIVMFENAQHDFPQRIRYQRDGRMLTARISTIDGRAERTWDFRKTPCD